MREIVVTGGGKKGTPENTCADILNLDSLMWSTGPVIPYRLRYPALVQIRNTFMTIGGYDSDVIMEYDPVTPEWIVQGEYDGNYDNLLATVIRDDLATDYCQTQWSM